MTDIDALIARMRDPGPPVDSREPDYAAMRDMHHDPEAEMDAREDSYENGLY